MGINFGNPLYNIKIIKTFFLYDGRRVARRFIKMTVFPILKQLNEN